MLTHPDLGGRRTLTRVAATVACGVGLVLLVASLVLGTRSG